MMLGFRRNKSQDAQGVVAEQATSGEKAGFFGRLKAGLSKTRSGLTEGIAAYSVSFIEVVQALGVLGVIGFLLVWGLKTFELLPTEARALRHGSTAKAPLTQS